MNELQLETSSAGVCVVVNEPLSVAAPRATSEEPRRHQVGTQASPPNAVHGSIMRVAETFARGEQTLAQLEGCLKESRDVSTSAVVQANELQERLRLGVRMLQALDVQLKRGEQATPMLEQGIQESDAMLARIASASITLDTAAESAAARATEHVAQRIDAVLAEKLAWLDGEVQWRLARLGDVESQVERAVQAKLATFSSALDQVTKALAQRIDTATASFDVRIAKASDLARMTADAEIAIAHLEQRLACARHTLSEVESKLGGGVEELDARAQTLAALRDDVVHLTRTLSGTCADTGTALQTSIDEARRMQDSMRFLVERGEEAAGSLAIAEDRLARSKGGIDATLRALEPWESIVLGGDPTKIASAARGIAAVVREQLSSEMRVVSASLRQLAQRTERAFSSIELDPDGTARSHARAPDAKELAIEVLRLEVAAPRVAPVVSI
ncbi:MAG: hypothetical protein EXS10_01465 [Phycisphaerales bacterium]|nr:hypothetical protein [Phycisphaerales bacterium]